ncbi:MAG TPA: indole-3-glycerol-phosphate synthase [Gemmatimonadaceae bacterium]|nr:indole-3-glycerol-phosphate synthase [Gemmatimonadaceae bacterium]
MQALPTWSAPAGVLGTLVADARQRARQLVPSRHALTAAARRAPRPPSLAAALRGERVALIAEIKRRSPSKGDLNPGLSLPERARLYAQAGASALSILTQSSHFGGSPEDLAEAARTVPLPLLRKDFIVDPLQIVEARALGAAAVLLIARAVAPDELRRLAAVAREEGLEILVEVRDEAELETAVAADAEVVGVNNRNLETLAIDPAAGARLVPLLPADRPAVYESGVTTRADVERAAACGADAVLVGSVLSAAPDPAGLARELASVPRTGRGA